MRWTWDDNENRANERKHGLDFETAKLVKGPLMKKAASSKPAGKRKAEIEALEALPDEEIDTSDIPEILDWSGAKRGLLYRPPKRRITSRLDAGQAAGSHTRFRRTTP